MEGKKKIGAHSFLPSAATSDATRLMMSVAAVEEAQQQVMSAQRASPALACLAVAVLIRATVVARSEDAALTFDSVVSETLLGAVNAGGGLGDFDRILLD